MSFPPSLRLLPDVDFPWPPPARTVIDSMTDRDRATDTDTVTNIAEEAAEEPRRASSLPEPAVWVYPARTSGASRPRPVVLVHGFRGDHHGLALIAHDL